MSRKALLPAAAALLLAACSHGTIAHFTGMNPVLLGPRDRVRGGTPLVTTRSAKFEASNYKTDSNTGRGYSNTANTSSLDTEAELATHGDESVDIRVSNVEGTAWCTPLKGASAEETIIHGDVVRMGVK